MHVNTHRYARKGLSRRGSLLAVFVACLTVGSGASLPGNGASADTSVPNFDHIFVIIMENHRFDALNQAPYLTSLASSGALLTQSYAVRHPSLPNYLALTGGSTFGVTTDCTTCFQNAPNIAADRIGPSGRSWKAYMESMATPCSLTNTPLYQVKHNPFVYYDNIRTNPSECNKVVPYTQLSTDLASAATTPNFGWITPNMCNDAHDCSMATGDTWLSQNVPAILSSPAFTTQKSLLVVTFDEDDGSDANHIPTILVGSGIAPGTQSAVPYTAYSVLKTIETAWSLAPLTSNDTAAQPITDIFTDPTTTTVAPPQTIAARGPASSVTYASDSTTALRLSVPAGAQPGDVLVASLGFAKSAATVQPTLTAPPGWTLARRTNQGATSALAVFTHVLAAGETTFTWNTNVTVGGASFLAAFSGVDPTTPVDASAGSSITTASSTYAAPSVTTTGVNDMLVASYFAWRNGGKGTTWTAPPGMTEIGDATTTTSRSGSLDNALQSAAGASGTKTATASVPQTNAVTTLTALKPAPGSATTTAATTTPTTPDTTPTTPDTTPTTPPTTPTTPPTTPPATIAVRGPSSSVTYPSDATTALQLPVPAGAQPGDVLVASLGFGKSAATVQPTLTAPAGWTLARRTNQSTTAALAVFTHVLAAGETTFRWTTSVTVGGAIFMTAYSGVNTTTPVDVSAGSSVTTAGTTYAAPSVTTTGPNDMLVASYFAWRNGGKGTTWTSPPGMTEVGDATTTTSRSGSVHNALQANAGSSGTKVATASASQNNAVTTLTALRPA
jgi:hypothetical protein